MASWGKERRRVGTLLDAAPCSAWSGRIVIAKPVPILSVRRGPLNLPLAGRSVTNRLAVFSLETRGCRRRALKHRRGKKDMNDWLHELPIVWMAICFSAEHTSSRQ